MRSMGCLTRQRFWFRFASGKHHLNAERGSLGGENEELRRPEAWQGCHFYYLDEAPERDLSVFTGCREIVRSNLMGS
jgi:hypothetical protein